MARLLWGCYSVADHLEPRAFVADLLLYDRLVIPVSGRHGAMGAALGPGAPGALAGHPRRVR